MSSTQNVNVGRFSSALVVNVMVPLEVLPNGDGWCVTGSGLAFADQRQTIRFGTEVHVVRVGSGALHPAQRGVDRYACRSDVRAWVAGTGWPFSWRHRAVEEHLTDPPRH